MNQSVWSAIELIYTKVRPDIVASFKSFKLSSEFHTKAEGNPHHYCSFFLPYDASSGKIYLGHHIKADDWIPPGGHIEIGETPIDAAIREMKEELGVEIKSSDITPFSLTVKQIIRPGKCLTHYDVWHLVNIKEQPFNYLRSEYHDARWFTVKAGIAKIAKNPDFSNVLKSYFAE